MDNTRFAIVEPNKARVSLRSLLGVHGVTAAACKLAVESPAITGLIAAACGLVLLQAGVLAACTWRVPREIC
jgi:hypothetical protein